MKVSEITEANLMQTILELVPGFRGMWEEHLAFWEEDGRTIGGDVAEFGAYVRELLFRKERTPELDEIFAFSEELLRDGNSDVKDQIATNLLENLVNSAGLDADYDALFVGLLGPHSLEYCREWNRFSGGGILALEQD